MTRSARQLVALKKARIASARKPRSQKQIAALKKAQLASARKRKGHGKKIAAVAATAATLAAVAYTHRTLKGKKKSIKAKSKDHSRKPQGKMVTVYHRTHSGNVSSIEKHGLRGSNYGHGKEGHGRVHVSTSNAHTRVNKHRYGNSIIEVKVSRHALKKDHNEPGSPYYTVKPSDIKSAKRKKMRAKVSDNPFRHPMY